MKILVTGGRSGIGEAFIRRRLSLGDEVLATASSDVTLEDLRARLGDSPKLKLARWNLEAPSEMTAEFESFLSGGVDGLILNAAPATRVLKKLHEVDDAEIESTLSSAMAGNIWLLRRCLKDMSQRRFGRIVFVSSMTVHGTSRYGLYAMAKAGIESLVKVIATDYGEDNIRANILRLGVIATERNMRFWSRSDYSGLMGEFIPARDFGKPESVAEASDPFLSPNCYMNGSVLEVSGGLPNFRSEFFTRVKLRE